MEIDFDPAKRARTLKHRGLDFRDAPRVFEGPHITLEDLRKAYGERRFITFGSLEGLPIALAWTLRLAGGPCGGFFR